ncbi:MAG: HDOD domain-containing protein [Planctomycetes bacterium]|nr:HDOD domain-containing protein [Planctomycetota bacterium]
MPANVRRAVEERLHGDDLELPLLPRVATEVMRLCGSSDADAKAISDVLHSDPAIAGNVLRISNSAMFGGNQQITSLQQAVSRIGLARLTEVVMAISTCSKLFVVSEEWQPIVGDLRERSLLAGLFAREVARTARMNVETAFLQGLLHAMGKPVLMMMLHEIELSVGVLSIDVLGATLDSYHARIGARLAEKWELAQPIRDAIRAQDDWTAQAEPPSGAPLIQLAALLASATGVDRRPEASELQSDASVEALNLYPDELEAIAAMSEQILEMAHQIL